MSTATSSRAVGRPGPPLPGPHRPSAHRRHGRVRRLAGNPVAGAGALVWLLVVIVPLYVMLTTSLMHQDEALSGRPLALPEHWTLGNYGLVLRSGFAGMLVNNVVVTAVTVVVVVALCVPLAYTVVRTRSRWTRLAFRVFVLGLAIPPPVTIVPLYVMIGKLGLYDTLAAIILPTAAFAMPVTLLILVGTMRDIAEELYEAMALDGASPLRTLLVMVIPLSRSGISTVSVFTALNAWNGFLFPLILTQSDSLRVLTTGLYNLSGQYTINIPATLAAVVLSGIPMFVAYLVARRALIAGLMGVGGK